MIPLVQSDSEVAVRQFEEAFAERCGVKAAAAVCSGTAAIRLAWTALGIQDVTIPTYACRALQEAAEPFNVKSYVDTDYDVESCEASQGTADILVHLFGLDSASLRFCPIEDWTLSLGGIDQLRGQLGVCSTHASKMISTGRGGMVFGNDEAMIQGIRDMAGTGRRSVAMSSEQARLGIGQLMWLDDFIEQRRELAYFYSARFGEAGIECPDWNCGSVFFRYLIGVDDPAGKVADLAAVGIECGRGIYPLLHAPVVQDDRFPGASRSINRLLSVPCHPEITDSEAAFIADEVVKACGR